MRELLQQAKQSINNISDEQIKSTLLQTIELLEKKVKEFLLDVEDLTCVIHRDPFNFLMVKSI